MRLRYSIMETSRSLQVTCFFPSSTATRTTPCSSVNSILLFTNRDQLTIDPAVYIDCPVD